MSLSQIGGKEASLFDKWRSVVTDEFSAALGFLKFMRALTQIMSAMTACVSLPLAVLVHNVRELSLAFAVAAQCGVVEGALNKWWWWSSITCSWTRKMHFISLDVCQISLGFKWHLTFMWAFTWLYFCLLPSLRWLIPLQPPPPSQS